VNWEQAGICAVQWSSRKERKSHEEVFSQVQRLSSSHQHSLNLPGRKARPAFSRTPMHLLKQQHLTTCRQTSLVAMIFRKEFRPLIIVLAAMAVGLVVKEIKLHRHTRPGQNSNPPQLSIGSTGWLGG
jgi:hypothetical protein